jgi:hypothetical protein
VAYWKLDGNSSDATGNGHNGTDTSVLYGAGLINQAAMYTHSPSSFTQIADDAALKPTGSFTVNVWVKSTDTANAPVFVQSYSENPNVAGW